MRDLTIQTARVDRFVDIQLEPNGDLKLLPNGDLALDDDIDAVEQAIRWRLLTELGSWYLEPECGSEILSFAGRPNSPETAQLVESEIYRALSHDGFIMPDEIEIHTAPLDASRMTVILMVREALGVERAAFQFELNLISGELTGWQRIA
ncbi:MAG: hypothetical protein KatS3mg023_3722 [Armatimonadota bacterium]|nr:MAG: hypothetical protein KatS3mg023_3722 [Armatimonadota bacterium]